MKPVIKLCAFLLLAGMLFHTSCQKELSCENCKGNKPPIANAGTDQTIVLPKDSITLDGSASTDPDGTITSYKWTKISGPVSSNIVNPTSSKTLVQTLVMGVYKYELTITDNGASTAKDTVQIIVNDPAVNHPPVANAGRDQIITLPVSTINLDGSASSDPDNNITSYGWTKISGPSSFNIANPNAVQTQVTNLAQGTYRFELKVTDAGGLFSKDTLTVSVNAVSNQPPVANAGADQHNLTICNVTLDGSGSFDSDGTIVSSLWTQISGPVQAVITNPTILSTTISGLTQGIYNFRLQVTDNSGAIDDDTVQIEMISILSGQEIIYNGHWGCNDLCRDGDVYWNSPDSFYCDPNIPLKVSILLDTSSVWIDVHNINSPLPPINQFYWSISRGYLFVNAYEGILIGRAVTIKVDFL